MTAPFTPDQEARIAEIVGEVLTGIVKRKAHDAALDVEFVVEDIAFTRRDPGRAKAVNEFIDNFVGGKRDA